MNKGIVLDGSTICDDIKQGAKAHGLTVTELVGKAGVSFNTYRSWRCGRNPSFASLKKIYAVLKKLEARKK